MTEYCVECGCELYWDDGPRFCKQCDPDKCAECLGDPNECHCGCGPECEGK